MDRQQYLHNLLGRLDLEEYLRDVLSIQEIKESGSELIHSCRLPAGNHKNGDTNPSASINRETFLFNCFSCGLGGDIYWLTQQILDCNLGEAIETVENYCPDSTAVSYLEFRERLRKNVDRQELLKKDWNVYDPKILEPWIQYSTYLKNRGVSAEVQYEMKTGVRDKYGDFKEERIVIPHFFEGKLLGWTMRRGYNLGKPSSPKYLHSASLPKKDTLFNYDNAIKCGGPVIVVESPISSLVLMSQGIRNVVATFGVSMPDGQLDLLRDFEEVIVAFDGDHAGTNGALNIVKELSPYMTVSVCQLPDNKDPAEIENFQSYLEDNTVNGIVWTLEQRSKGSKFDNLASL